MNSNKWKTITATAKTLTRLEGARIRYCGPYAGSNWYVGVLENGHLFTDAGECCEILPGDEIGVLSGWREMTATAAVRRWGADWRNATRTAPAPTAKQIVRHICRGYDGGMSPAGYARHYDRGFDAALCGNSGYLSRPARSVVTETGVAGYGIEYLPLTGARKLWERYRRFFLYMEETRHDWQLSRTVGYADGTTESVYVSQLTGETRIK